MLIIMNWRCAYLIIVLLVPLLVVRRCAAAKITHSRSMVETSLLPLHGELKRRPDTLNAISTGPSAEAEVTKSRVRRRRAPREEVLYGAWKSDEEETAANKEMGEEMLDKLRLRSEGPNVLSGFSPSILEQLLAAGGGSKSRNSRNRASHDMDVLEKLVEMYSLKQNSLMKRGEGPQLSVVSPLDVLRQQLIYEMARRRQKERQDQIRANDELLKNVGKRSVDNADYYREDGRAGVNGGEDRGGHGHSDSKEMRRPDNVITRVTDKLEVTR